MSGALRLRGWAALRSQLLGLVAATLPPIQRAVLLPVIARHFDLFDDLIRLKGNTDGD